VNDEVRVNYTSNANTSSSIPDAFGGATPVDLVRLQGFDSQSGRFAAINIALAYDSFFPNVLQSRQEGVQKQWNIVNTLGQSLGRHHLKYGIDYRRLTPENHVISPVAVYDYFSEDSVRANSVDLGIGTSTSPAFPIYTNFSAFAQDEWRVKSRLSLALGLRWEVNPAPGAPKGNLPFTLQGDIGNPSSLKLAPQGTPLWKTAWFNFAPRLGAAYILRNDPSTETVVRGGVGVFFDTGQQNGSWGYQGPGFSALTFFGGLFGSPASFPVAPAQVAPTIVSPPVAPYSVPVYASPTHLQLPFTLQWNASIQQALGNSRALTLSYVGANARRLLQQKEFSIQQAVNPDISTVVLYTNGLTSDYNAFQIQLQQRVDRGLQVLASYTFAHALDYGSQDTAFHYVRGNSDFDVRHTFSAALMYDVPHRFSNHLAQALLHHWGFDDRFTARTGFPVSLQGQQLTDPATGQQSFAGLNVVPGASLYIQGPQFPGGRSINPAAFSRPSAGQFGDAPRNFVRGFGAWQMDFAIRRDFPLYESLKLQFRAEAFNIFNHPNFGSINARCGGTPGTPGCTNPQFGQATATLAQSLGGLSPLYQVGGPRSLQFALKLIF